VLAYQKRLSGPLLDRIDLIVHVPRVPNSTLLDANALGESQHNNASASIQNVHIIQKNRYRSSVKYNNNLTSKEIKTYAHLPDDAKSLLTKAADKMGLSARSYFKIIKVARTIADLADEETVSARHITEALQYRDTGA